MSKRINRPELMDLGPGHYTEEEYRDCLYQLKKIGQYLGGDRATFWALDQLKSAPSSILDVGCGGGSLTMQMAARYPAAHVAGMDISREAISYANEQLLKYKPVLSNLEFVFSSSPSLENLSQEYDILTTSLVCHHLSDEELVNFLKQACSIAKKAVIMNDLHRHRLASIGFASLVPLLFRNRLIWHDGLLSIKRSFTYKDWLFYLDAAGIHPRYCKVTWHWPFRWTVIIDAAAQRGKR